MEFLQRFLLAVSILSPVLSNAQEGDIDEKMQKVAAQFAERIRATGKNRVGVADFNDLQGNVPELGKFLAENLQGELVNNQLRIVNRQRIEQLLIENKLTAQRLLDPTNALTLGKAAGMEVIVTGTITPLDERSIVLNVLALDIQGAMAIASAKTTLNRTASLNDLMRSTVKQGGGNGSLQETSTLNSNTSGQSVGYVLMGDKSIELPRESCNQDNKNSGLVDNYGQVCFENILKKPLVLYYVSGITTHVYYHPNTLIGANARNCAPLLYTDRFDGKMHNASYEFYFHTNEEDEHSRLYGKISVEVEGCQIKTRVINSDRLFLSKAKPN